MFFGVLVMTAMKIRTVFLFSQKHFSSESKDSYSILKRGSFQNYLGEGSIDGSQLKKTDL